MKFIDGKPRCNWIKDHSLYLKYHDEEWGVPIYDDHKLFELLVLESAEAGLSWLTILKKRANYRLAYDNFDPEKVACYDSKKEEELLMNAGIIRSKSKIISSLQNARKFLEIQKQYGSFSNSPYARTLFWRKFISSFMDAIFAATSNLYLIAK